MTVFLLVPSHRGILVLVVRSVWVARVFFAKVDSRSKAPTLQSDSSRIVVTPLAGASGLTSTSRITVPSQVGKVKGKGIRPPRNSKY